MAPNKKGKAIVKKTKKSKSERKDEKPFYHRLTKGTARIGQRYIGDQRSK